MQVLGYFLYSPVFLPVTLWFFAGNAYKCLFVWEEVVIIFKAKNFYSTV